MRIDYNIKMYRRNFIKNSVLASLAVAFSACCSSTKACAPRILLVSGWQSVNIGDIAHTVGMIQTIKDNIPNAKISLWKVQPDPKVDTMLAKHFPDVKIHTFKPALKSEKTIGTDIEKTFAENDILVHASGPSVVARGHISAWRSFSSKPYGVFGVTLDKFDPQLDDILKNAAFIYTRETDSLKNMKSRGVAPKVAEFIPDATFAFAVSDKSKAEAFLQMNKNVLGKKNFVCFIPRLRYTPYWEIRKVSTSPEEIQRRKKVNAECATRDLAKMRDVIKWLCANTKYNVLLCPEMTYQVQTCKEIYDSLKNELGDRIITRGYWNPDEATSVYKEAAAVVSFECHSPILAMACGTPAFYLRQKEDTIKGQMYYDLGFKNWVFEIDETSAKDIEKELQKVLSDKVYAKQILDAGMKNARDLMAKGCQIMRGKCTNNTLDRTSSDPQHKRPRRSRL